MSGAAQTQQTQQQRRMTGPATFDAPVSSSSYARSSPSRASSSATAIFNRTGGERGSLRPAAAAASSSAAPPLPSMRVASSLLGDSAEDAFEFEGVVGAASARWAQPEFDAHAAVAADVEFRAASARLAARDASAVARTSVSSSLEQVTVTARPVFAAAKYAASPARGGSGSTSSCQNTLAASQVIVGRPLGSAAAAQSAAPSTNFTDLATALPVPAPLPTRIDESKLPAIQAFLQSLYPSSSPPRVELTPYTVEALGSLVAHVNASDARAALVEDNMLAAAREYEAEAGRLEAALARVGMCNTPAPSSSSAAPSSSASFDMLSPTAKQHLAQLTDLAQLLALKDVEAHTYASGLVSARDEYHSSLWRLRTSQSSLQRSQAHSAESASLLSSLRRLGRALSHARSEADKDARAKRGQMSYFSAKSAEYVREREDIAAKLARAGFDPDTLSHEALVRLANQIRQVEEQQIAPLDAALAPYASLPPDITLAHVRVAAARQELAELEGEFNAQVQLMHQDTGEY
jgi:hypothetical protein